VAYVVDTLPMLILAGACLGDPRHRAVLSTSDTPATIWQTLTDGADGLDPARPVALLAVDVLDHIERALDFLAGRNTSLPIGSVLVLSHGTDDGLSPRRPPRWGRCGRSTGSTSRSALPATSAGRMAPSSSGRSRRRGRG
jgi:hypothetical protein